MEFTLIIAVVIALAVGVVLVGFLDRRPAPPKGTYKEVRDPDDPGRGGTAVLEREPEVVEPEAEPEPEVVEPETEVVEPEAEVVEPEAEPEPEVERPEAAGSRLQRLRARLLKSNNVFGKSLLALLSRDRIDEDVWDEVEETLLMADLGTEPTMELVDRLRDRVKVEGTQDPEQVRSLLREELLAMVDPSMDRRLEASRKGDRPAITMVVGVNGVGKTTTVGKLARVLVAEDRKVVLGAADTFRAAAAEQLATWGARVGVDTVRSDKDGADPASVAYEAVAEGIRQEADVVLVDTAGRLQNKANLMDELGKIKRVIEKQGEVDEVLLVLDATTGQNGLTQAKVFAEVVDVTGIVLTKLDGTAKGGIVVAIQRQLGVPVKLVGLGEGADDLAPFSAEGFVDALLAD
ncbi:signal recognition particle-docking protein FtsY [Micrococcus lylae]|uniref:signal recognition particle-docking protein FtsY n=1 Tax=Micrococcus lylae TaxID=1273 RepID=UPI0021A29656|nr:signal recognition particle-docking protein FtsY [Micrococcus lylae]MCT2008446.1 signal recognition particle-docking protein FtsY [Micrococcus lylae]MCT2072450.1 signal recognition particle-docking protein FtsY [Micrococcus lylae]